MKGLWSRAVPLIALAGVAALFSPSANSAPGYCYTVVDAHNQIVVQGPDAPVDLSRPVAPQVERQYPGGHLIVTQDVSDCRLVHLPGGHARRSLTVTGAAPVRASQSARPAVLRLPQRPGQWMPEAAGSRAVDAPSLRSSPPAAQAQAVRIG